jgi:hypothetical protein
MKFAVALCLVVALSGAHADQSNPIGKVLQLMNDFKAKIIKEGENEAAAYKKFFEWCDDASSNLGNDIKGATAKKNQLTAKIQEATSDVEVGTSKVEDLSGAVSTAELS